VPVPLPTTPEGICARLLSGDANADNLPDDLDGNGVPDLQELLTLLGGGGAGGTSGGRQVVGLPSVPGSQG
jgi:phospholipid/cholesterol/gamma-HCH transport system substrate-binding protein